MQLVVKWSTVFLKTIYHCIYNESLTPIYCATVNNRSRCSFHQTENITEPMILPQLYSVENFHPHSNRIFCFYGRNHLAHQNNFNPCITDITSIVKVILCSGKRIQQIRGKYKLIFKYNIQHKVMKNAVFHYEYFQIFLLIFLGRAQ